MAYKFFDKKSASGISVANNEIKQNLLLAEELHKLIIEKLKKTQFIQNLKTIFGVRIQLISKFNKEFRFLLCVIDNFNKYSWVAPLKDKKGKYC